MSTKGWDYVVIGAGAAGCVVAGRLSQMLPEARIALIEAGRERLGMTTRVPGIAFIASTFPRQNWNYQTEPVPALNGRRGTVNLSAAAARGRQDAAARAAEKSLLSMGVTPLTWGCQHLRDPG
jgi:choline dehydrogenase-like flavoprotein